MGNEKLRKVNNLPFCNYWIEMIKKEIKRQEGGGDSVFKIQNLKFRVLGLKGFRFGDKREGNRGFLTLSRCQHWIG